MAHLSPAAGAGSEKSHEHELKCLKDFVFTVSVSREKAFSLHILSKH